MNFLKLVSRSEFIYDMTVSLPEKSKSASIKLHESVCCNLYTAFPLEAENGFIQEYVAYTVLVTARQLLLCCHVWLENEWSSVNHRRFLNMLWLKAAAFMSVFLSFFFKKHSTLNVIVHRISQDWNIMSPAFWVDGQKFVQLAGEVSQEIFKSNFKTNCMSMFYLCTIYTKYLQKPSL